MRLTGHKKHSPNAEQPKEYMYAATERLRERITTESDEDLVRQFQNGNRDAFRQLVERNQDKVRSIILYTLNRGDVVDDIAQDVFIKVYKALDSFRFDSKFYTWLYRITVNKCRDELRKRRLKRFIPLHHSSDDEPRKIDSLVTEQQHDDFRDVVHSALRKLPVRQREIIILKDIQDYSYEEIAEILHCEMGTVKSRLSRARAVMRKLLESYIDETV
jgi:RNA polymerase sigma-70 factor, ECF subfamily